MGKLEGPELERIEYATTGRADPKFVVDSSLDGSRITNPFGDPPGAMDTMADLGGVQGGGARRLRRKTRRRRSLRRSRGRVLLNLRLRVSSRQRHRHRS